MEPLPKGPTALDAILDESPCERARPRWIGVEDERDLGFLEAQYVVHLRLVATGRAAGPLRIALARIAAVILGQQTWKPLGFVREADYAQEQLGISKRELQELGRVGARLDDLPALEAALADGRLSWSKVALLVGIALPENEEAWIEQARELTVKALRKRIRAARAESQGSSAESADDEEPPRQFFQIACSAQVRRQWHRVRELAHRVAGRSVSAAECIEMMTAEVLSAIPLEPDAPYEAPDRAGQSWADALPPLRWPHRPREEEAPIPGTSDDDDDDDLVKGASGDEDVHSRVAEFLLSLVEGIEDADPRGIDRRMRECLSEEQRLDSQIGSLLSIIDKKRTYRRFELASATRYAEEWIGVSQRKAQMLLRIEHAVQRCPPLAWAYRSSELSWVQAHELVPLVYADSLERWMVPWVERAKRVTVRQLRDDVERACMIRATELDTWQRTGGLPAEARPGANEEEEEPEVSAKTSASSTIGFSGESELIRTFWATLWTVRKRIERVTGTFPTEGEAFEVMMDHVLDAWGADAKVKREHRIMARDGWRCAVPTCTSRRELHVHHIVPRSQGGGDEETNLITLCVAHHLRGVHGGTLEITGKAPDQLLFKLGTRPDGPPLAVYRSGGIIVESARG